MPKVRVGIADDHAMLRAGLKLLINSQADMEVTGEAGNHAETLGMVAACQPDVLTLDLSMPGGQPMRLVETLAREHPGTRILVLTMHEDPAFVRMALAAGASGYLVKRSADSELLSAIRTLARGGIHAQVGLETPQHGLAADTPGTGMLNSLSDREREVFLAVARGQTNQAIADKLFLSVKTIESYRARLMAKLGLNNRAELTQLAISSGLLEPDPGS